MHNAAFEAVGLSAHYQAVDVAPADLAAALQNLRARGVLGANLSLPHKEAALPLLDSLSDAARAIGAVNTVVNRKGQLHGDNTDAAGLLLALQDAGLALEEGRLAAVLGAGGAARSAVWALRLRGLRVVVVNRTHQRAQQLTDQLGGKALTLTQVPWPEVSLVVNASSAGLGDAQATPLPHFDFAALPSALVYDMVYKPAETALMREARAAGLRAENGLGMLAHQARLAFLAWTGQNVAIDIFKQALAARGASGAAAQ